MSGVFLWFTGGVQLHKTDVEDNGDRIKSVGPTWESKVYKLLINDPISYIGMHICFQGSDAVQDQGVMQTLRNKQDITK